MDGHGRIRTQKKQSRVSVIPASDLCLWGLACLLLIGLSWVWQWPSWIYGIAFVLTYLFNPHTLTSKIPFYLSVREVATVLARILPHGASMLEAGCADARLALAVCRARPDVMVCAVENAWGSWALAYCRWLCAGRPSNMQLLRRNFWHQDWEPFNVIYVFLSPIPMLNIWQKCCAEGSRGQILISNTFAIPKIAPQQRIALNSRLQPALYLYATQ